MLFQGDAIDGFQGLALDGFEEMEAAVDACSDKGFAVRMEGEGKD